MIESVETRRNTLIVRLKGSLDIGTQESFKKNLADQINQGLKQVVLDFAGVSFIDSACLGALVSLARALRAEKGDVVLTSLQEEVLSIFQITRLDKIFKIFENETKAIKSFSQN